MTSRNTRRKMWSRKHALLTGVTLMSLVGITVGIIHVHSSPEEAGDPDAVDPVVFQKWNTSLHGGLSGSSAARAYLKAWKQTKAMPYFYTLQDSSTLPPTWQPIGPSPIVNGQTNTAPAPVSGRVITLAISGGTLYAGAANGGVWRTDTDGSDWTPLTDAQASLSMGSIAIDPNHPSVVYAATGEMDNSGDDQYGQGILKSTDDGRTWVLLANNLFAGVKMRKILVDPNDSNHLYLASEKGFFESRDAGTTWLNSSVNGMSNVPASDIEIDPKNPTTLYITMGVNGIYKSTNSGATWFPLTVGLPPKSDMRRTTAAVSPSNPNILYVAVSNQEGHLVGLYRSDNGGDTFVQLSSTPDYMSYPNGPGQGNFDNCLAVDPKDPNHVFAGGILLEESTDGGSTWTDVTSKSDLGVGIHVDQHALVFDGSGNLIVGNDGGVWERTFDGTWKDLNTNLSITQLYPGMSSDFSGSVLMAGTQDNGTDYTDGTEWRNTFGGDGGYTAIDGNHSNIRYCEYVKGYLLKSSDSGGTWAPISPTYIDKDSVPFLAPYELAPTNQSDIVLGADRVYRSEDAGTHWTAISPEYTHTLSDGKKVADPITAVAISPYDADVIYAGTQYGQVLATFDGGTNWVVKTPSGFDATSGVTAIAVGRVNTEVAVTYGSMDFPNANHHVFYSVGNTSQAQENMTFQDITGNLPNAGVNAVLFDGATLYVGTDVGVFARNEKSDWGVVGRNLPGSPVYSLLFSPTGELIAGTHGRGAFILRALSIGTSSPFPNPTNQGSVLPHPQSLSIQPTRLTLRVHGRIVLKVSVAFSDGTTRDVHRGVSFKSDNTKIVRVTPNGVISGVKQGVTYITISYGKIFTRRSIVVK